MKSKSERLISVDILRGLTIIFMIIVNDPGSWSHVYAPLLHAEWNGITPTDYIFPTFLFIVGVSIVLSLSKKKDGGLAKNILLKKIIWRSIKIYLVGLFLWLWPDFDFENIRWAGVLQRISFVYLFCALIFLYLNLRSQIIFLFLILVFYTIIMCFIPVPGIGYPDLSVPEKNWAHYIDTLLLPGVMWEDTWDPEGILTTLPSIGTGILGLIGGYILTSKSDLIKKMLHLSLFGFVLFFLGDISQYIFPLNKNLWSTSFTLLVGGISSLSLCFCLYICDYLNLGERFKFAQSFGVNSIFSYMMAGMLTFLFYDNKIVIFQNTLFDWGIGLNQLFINVFSEIGLPLKLLSFLFAVFYVIIVWIPTSYLFKRKIFIKL
ncbi:MAG: heparan-alpha-glucosaminide N-acetyltransferase [Flavobacteriaceae bacterium]|nr:heparan-alpha-glucosaminide N-acetyltransferase [Flavobacteriaceae bacterium]|tara:strand:- start:711 stop:1838 length:1128 start_codon:yes stop_codon:yes gene_type:complete